MNIVAAPVRTLLRNMAFNTLSASSWGFGGTVPPNPPSVRNDLAERIVWDAITAGTPAAIATRSNPATATTTAGTSPRFDNRARAAYVRVPAAHAAIPVVQPNRFAASSWLWPSR